MAKINSRRKGHNFERQVADDLRHIFPTAMRLLEYQKDDCNGIDLKKTGVFDIQCKCKKTYVPVNTIEEIKGKGVPLVVTKALRKETMAILPWDFLLKMMFFYEKYKDLDLPPKSSVN